MVPTIVCLHHGRAACDQTWTQRGANIEPFMPSLHYVCSGAAAYVEEGITHVLEPNRLYFFPRNKARRFLIADGAVYEHWYVNFSIVPIPLESEACELTLPDAEAHLLEALVQLQDTPVPDACIETLLTAFISLVLYRNGIRLSSDERLTATLRTISEKYHTRLTISQLAAQVHLAPRYFISYFTKAMSETPHQYILKYRINIADKLLSSGATVTETACKTGFPTIYAFSAAYKKIKGHPPKSTEGDRDSFTERP